MNGKREGTARLILAVLGVLITLVMVEGLARLLAPAPAAIQYTPDPETGYRHAPNQNLWVRDEAGEHAVRFTTNAYGSPDRERTAQKPASAYRIAVIGDSMVEAAQVAPEERFTYRLEEQLNAWAQSRAGPVRSVEVLNFGVAGYSTAQEWRSYRAHVRRFNPDLVVLVFLPGNDVKNNSYELEVVQSCRPELAPFYRLTAGNELALVNEDFYDRATARFEPDPPAGRDWLNERVLKKIRLVSLAGRAVAAVQNGPLTGDRAARLDQDACQTKTTLQLYDPEVQQSSPDWQDAWRVTAALIEQLAADVAADQAEFLLVSVTGPWEVQPETRDLVLSKAEQARYDWALAQQMTAAMVDRLSLPHFAALPAMQQAQQAGTAVHFRYNGHYTPAGHEILAHELLPVLQAILTE